MDGRMVYRSGYEEEEEEPLKETEPKGTTENEKRQYCDYGTDTEGDEGNQ